MTTDAWHDRVLGGYRVGARLGPALGGHLYAAEQIDRGRLVVLKIVTPSVAASPGFAERFDHDAGLLGAFIHPHVVTVYDSGVVDGTHYIAMRPLEGPTLERLIADAGMLDHVRVTELVAQIAAALDAVHERGVVHRGLSPASIVVRRHKGAELASITDFAVTDDTELYGGLFDRPSGSAPPPIDYAAPEQVRGQPATPRTDVYALGAILFCALTGSPPFSDRHAGATLEAHLNEPVPSVALIDELPAGFDEIFARALAKDPADRYGSASELAVALPNKLRVLSTWRSMLVAGTMAPGAGADADAAAAAKPVPVAPPAALGAPVRPEPGAALQVPLAADDDGVFDLGDDEVDTDITGETGELPQTETELDDSLVARALAPPELPPLQRRVGRQRAPRYRPPRNRTKQRKKRPLPDIEPIAVPVRPEPERRKRSKAPFAGIAILLLATVASLLAAAGVFDGSGNADGERASISTTTTVSEARALAQLRKDGERRVARERATRKAAGAKAAGDKAAADKAAADKAAADKAAADKAAADKAAADKAAADKAKADKAAAAKAKADKAAADKSEATATTAPADKAATAKAKADKAAAAKVKADQAAAAAKADKAAADKPAGTGSSGSAAKSGSSTSAAGAGGSAASLRWPAGRSAYTAVIYASSSDRAGALKRARRAAAKIGVRAGVLRSSDFSNLEPGVWVAFAGVYRSEAQAQRMAGRLKRAGLAPAPYTRFVASR